MADDFPTDEFYRAREHFHRLLDLVPELRHKHLEELRRKAPELAVVVAELLERADDGGQAESPATYPVKHGLSEGDIVADRYRILRLIGEGGMAEVYLARRIDGIDQEVALKLVRGGSRMMVRRFVRERQILASLTHPRIAHLIDGGLTGDGLPWFAMEYIRGEPIHTWCDRQRLDLRERARLFARVCRTVQFAHRNLVLHRDLKPSNILVDDLGQPHLLDFGIAKLIDATDPEKTQTVAMTPAYAAPEQLRGQGVSTASDIFQLGLVLRQLLTGATPGADRHGGSDHTRSRPRLDQTFAAYSSDQAERIAQARGSQPARLKRVLRGDLDRIVRRATAEDPRERYETAQALGDDLDRWRRGLPVNAHGGSFGYRAGKLLRRHAIAASVVFLCAVGLVASTIYSYQRAESERLERQRSDTVLGFMRNVFQQGNPARSGGRNLSPAELLQRAAVELERTEGLDDQMRAMLLTEIAVVFNTLGLPGQAEPYAQLALDLLEDNRERHANAYLETVSAVITAKRDLGLADEVINTIDRALPLAENSGGHTRPWRALLPASRGYAYIQTGDYERARRDLHDALSIFDQHGIHDGSARGVVLGYLGHLAYQQEDYEQSIEMYRQSFTAYQGAEMHHIDLLAARYGLVQNYVRSGRPRQAVDEYERLITDTIESISADDVRVSMLRTSLALAYAALGDYESAGRAMDAIPEEHLDPRRLLALRWPLTELTRVLLLLGQLQFDAALSEIREIFMAADPGGEAQDVPRDRQLHRGYWLWAETLLQLGRCDEAVPMLERLLSTPGVTALVTADAHDSLGRCALVGGTPEQAEAHFKDSVALLRSKHTHGSPALLRGEIHVLWAQTLSTRQPALLEEIETRRAHLVELLGSESRPVIWQLDLLADELHQALDQSQPHPERRTRAEAALKALAGTTEIPHFVGLVSLG